jgi:hypothetical protein
VALWALGFVRVSVRARTGGCGSGSSLSRDAGRVNKNILLLGYLWQFPLTAAFQQLV